MLDVSLNAGNCRSETLYSIDNSPTQLIGMSSRLVVLEDRFASFTAREESD